jgi:alkanesulfonate monooxygenase SsuD/methylene tetrahydromethanopterin reductase-like flavin-dependent oxidoreductase (luciferase family)
MKLGLGVYSSEVTGKDITLHQEFQNDLAEARLAEEVGLDSIWYTEHHFLPATQYNPNVLGMCAAVAAVTSRIELGPAVILGPLYHPIRLAEDCAMVDQLSGGRFTLGIGLGYRDSEYEGIGVARRERAPRTEEIIAILRQAWSASGRVDFDGKYFQFHDVDVSPRPYQTGGPRVWVAGYKEVTLDRVARMGDGWIMDGGTDASKYTGGQGYNRDIFDRVSTMVDLLKEACSKHGRRYEDLDFALTIGGFMSEHGADDAWRQLQEAYMHSRRVYGQWYGLDPTEYERWYPELMTQEQHAARRTEIWLGSPEELLPKMRRLREIVGERLHVMYRNKYPGIPHEATCASIRLMGQLRDRLNEG